MFSVRNLWALFVLVLICPSLVLAESEQESGAKEKTLNRLTITDSVDDASSIPGSIQKIDAGRLAEKTQTFGDIHRVLREVPGVNIQEEEGYGLRPNIGLRGTSTERSSKVTLMEDGVLIAPAPYAAPSAYYFPTVSRMKGIEVSKGASQIKYGPQTTGGAINMSSTPIPEEASLHVTAAAGQENLKKIYAHGGASSENVGFMLETYQFDTDGFKELDGGGDTGYHLEDYLGKLRLSSGEDADVYQYLEVKLQLSDQLSDDTYLGLTDADFDENPNRRYAASQLDNIDADHKQVQVTHFAALSENWDITNTLYSNYTERNWFKLEKVGGTGVSSILRSPEEFAEELAIIKGATSADDALALRNNQRNYESMGWQLILAGEVETGSVVHQLEFGARYHEDEEDRFQNEEFFRMDNGTLVKTSEGAPGSQANRIGSAEAWAFHIQDSMSIGELTLVPGVRYETVDLKREDFGKEDPSRSGADLNVVENSVDAIIPGLGIHYAFTDSLGAFFGIHRGFGPPGPTSNTEVEEEESINYEWGTRYNQDSLKSEVVLFYSDYENLLGADTLSGGGEGTGELFNAGEVSVFGVEFLAAMDLGELCETELSFPASITYTYTDAEFDEDFDSDFFGLVSSGDQLPYIPENQLALSLGVEGEGWLLRVDSHYVDEMPVVPGQSGLRAEDKTDSYFVVDLTGEVEVKEDIRFFASLENLADEEYIVARRPAGARPGLPLTFVAGVKMDI